jgi:hypothetical protein
MATTAMTAFARGRRSSGDRFTLVVIASRDAAAIAATRKVLCNEAKEHQ